MDHSPLKTLATGLIATSLIGTGTSLGAERQPTLLYLKLQLDAANKVSAKLNAKQNFLNLILTEYAQNPSAQKSDWASAPFTFEETIQEALTALNS